MNAWGLLTAWVTFLVAKNPGFYLSVTLIEDIWPHRGEKTTARLFGIDRI